MKHVLLTATALALLSAPLQASTLVLEVFDNATMIGTVTSNTGKITFVNDTAPGFNSIDIAANGLPDLPGGDLSSTTLDVSSSSSTTSHTLTIDLFQVGVSVPSPGHTESSFSVNHLAGANTIGPTVESTFFGGSTTALGTLLTSHVFPIGTVSDGAGPFSVNAGVGFVSDAQQYVIPFGPHTSPQSANDTIELTTGIPEPSTWAMLAIGFGLMAWGVSRNRKTPLHLFA